MSVYKELAQEIEEIVNRSGVGEFVQTSYGGNNVRVFDTENPSHKKYVDRIREICKEYPGKRTTDSTTRTHFEQTTYLPEGEEDGWQFGVNFKVTYREEIVFCKPMKKTLAIEGGFSRWPKCFTHAETLEKGFQNCLKAIGVVA